LTHTFTLHCWHLPPPPATLPNGKHAAAPPLPFRHSAGITTRAYAALCLRWMPRCRTTPLLHLLLAPHPSLQARLRRDCHCYALPAHTSLPAPSPPRTSLPTTPSTTPPPHHTTHPFTPTFHPLLHCPHHYTSTLLHFPTLGIPHPFPCYTHWTHRHHPNTPNLSAFPQHAFLSCHLSMTWDSMSTAFPPVLQPPPLVPTGFIHYHLKGLYHCHLACFCLHSSCAFNLTSTGTLATGMLPCCSCSGPSQLIHAGLLHTRTRVSHWPPYAFLLTSLACHLPCTHGFALQVRMTILPPLPHPPPPPPPPLTQKVPALPRTSPRDKTARQFNNNQQNVQRLLWTVPSPSANLTRPGCLSQFSSFKLRRLLARRCRTPAEAAATSPTPLPVRTRMRRSGIKTSFSPDGARAALRHTTYFCPLAPATLTSIFPMLRRRRYRSHLADMLACLAHRIPHRPPPHPTPPQQHACWGPGMPLSLVGPPHGSRLPPAARTTGTTPTATRKCRKLAWFGTPDADTTGAWRFYAARCLSAFCPSHGTLNTEPWNSGPATS